LEEDGLNIEQLRNIGIVAHVDAGKTTISEQMLYLSGEIRSPGRVDEGTAHTDRLEVERERGISVRAATTVFPWKGHTINLIDTPGHVDFTSEVERSLRVLDGAVLVVSAAEGVQAHTETLWRALQTLGIPTILFINKMDRIGADPDGVLAETARLLTPDAVPVQWPIGSEQHFAGVADVWDGHAYRDYPGLALVRERLYESVAERDERMLEAYVQGGPIEDSQWKEAFVRLARQAKIVPVLYGAAIRGIGVEPLLNAILDYLPAPRGDADKPLSGVVFKLERSKSMGKLAYVRLYDGSLSNREAVYNATLGAEEKVTQIRQMRAQSYKDTGRLLAGDIGVVCGLSNTKIGDILGNPASVPPEHRLSVPLLTVQAHPLNEADFPALAEALAQLAEEDPLLDLQWLHEERELHIKVTGTVQLEILASLLLSRFGLQCRFSEPSVIYKETPTRPAEGYVAYTMPKPCWAILRFAIEPGPRGSGLVYRSVVRQEQLLERYQNEVERRVPEALQQGLYGWEVTDLKITLIEGEHHVWHTHPLDFVVATPMGIMDGLTNTGTTLLEPMLEFRIAAPEETGGRILGDLVRMRAEFDPPAVMSGRFTVEGKFPVATSLDYAVKLGSLTGGRGVLTTRFAGYQECPLELGAIRPRRGIDPRDRSKYILAARNALS
jgi:ribosomal protection tetracycline resistance protein